MSQSKISQTFKWLILSGALVSFASCLNSGDTDGGPGNDSSGLGSQVVSDGGFGAKLVIRLKDGGETIGTADQESFFVDATDPSGLPLAFRRVFCESEKGIAIIEPSSGGVAFEHTGADGSMSGVLGGVTPGSYLLECRLEEGFNLVARKRIKVEGDVPAGFQGFPGAAGGNLGGGRIVDNPNNPTDLTVTSVQFTDAGSTSSNGPIDTSRDSDCDNDGVLDDPEPYTFSNYIITINNPSTLEAVTVNSVEFIVRDGRNVTSSQTPHVTIAAGDSGTITGSFTEFVAGTAIKTFAATTNVVLNGTYDIDFVISGETTGGDDVSLNATATVTFAAVDNCT